MIEHDEDDFDCERNWKQVRWAGIKAGFGDDVSRWTHFQALGAIELVLETYNYVSNAAALGILQNRVLKLERSNAGADEVLFRDWPLLARLRTCDFALYDIVGHVVGRLGGGCDDHHDVLRDLDRVAEEMGYRCSTELHMTAPVSDICSMLDWAWWEATARHRLCYRANAELPN